MMDTAPVEEGPSPKNVFVLTTIQSSAIKSLFESLKDLMLETSFQLNEDGMFISTMDVSSSILLNVKLDASNFELFECNEPMTVGINTHVMYRLMRTIGLNDSLTIFVDYDSRDELGIIIVNTDKQSKTTYKVKILNVENEPIEIDDIVRFKYVISIQSTILVKLLKDLMIIGDLVEISTTGKETRFLCKGDFASQDTVLNDSIKVVELQSDEEDALFCATYNIRALLVAAKCSTSASTVELRMSNNLPLVMHYSVGSLGKCQACFAPKTCD